MKRRRKDHSKIEAKKNADEMDNHLDPTGLEKDLIPVSALKQ